MSVCKHIQTSTHSAEVPSTVPQNTKVYKDDCMFNFDTPENNELGLDICLTCLQAFSRGDIVNYTKEHSDDKNHQTFLNILKTLKPEASELESNSVDKENQTNERQQKIAKLEIKENKESDIYDSIHTIYCAECDSNQSVEDVPLKLQNLVESILKTNSSNRDDEIKAWEQEIYPCEHSIELIQQKYTDIIDLTKCHDCELQENLWICLHCGIMGCGREQFGSTMKGNSHALKHYETSGHPVAVKLGSLSATDENNCDCYCYHCNDEVKVPQLSEKLITFGIDIQKTIKTEKNLIEINLDQNLNWDFKLDSNNGEKLQPIFGPDFTGFQNMGNSCYLNSVIQALFVIPEFENFFKDAKFPKNIKDPATDLYSQLLKINNGLKSGRYAKPNPNTIKSKGDDYQLGIKPSAFKTLIGDQHPEFKTQRQQDAFEFLLYLLDKIDNEFGFAFTSSLKFLMGNKVICSNCNHGKVNYELIDNLALPVEEKFVKVEQDKKIYEDVQLIDCFKNYCTTQAIEGFQCDNCSEKTIALQTSGFKTFPRNLIVNAKRIKLENWVPVKIDLPIKIQELLDLYDFKESQFEAGETELKLSDKSNEFLPNEEHMGILLSMGFSELRAIKALYNTGNKNAEDAMNWLFAHMEDADIDEPFDPSVNESTSSTTKANNEPSEESIENLVAMGFSNKLSRKALILNNNDINASVEWLFSNPDDDGEIEENSSSKPVINLAKEKESLIEQLLKTSEIGEAKYKVKSVICHKGTSPHTGHYVVFIRKIVDGAEKWVLFNDEKVVACDENSISDIENNGYIYVLERV